MGAYSVLGRKVRGSNPLAPTTLSNNDLGAFPDKRIVWVSWDLRARAGSADINNAV